MNRFTLLVFLAVAACSRTASPGLETAPTAPTVITGSGNIIELAVDSRGFVARIPVAMADAWAALPSIYNQLGIAPKTIVPAARQIGNLDFVATGRLGGVRLGEYFRCGRTTSGAPAADSYRLYISILTDLDEITPTETEIHTLVQASARSNSGASTDPVLCASTGELESRIVKALQ